MITKISSNVKMKLTVLAISLLTVLAVGFTAETAFAALCSRSDCPCVTVANPSNAVGPCSHYYSNGKLCCRTKGHIY